MSSKHPALIVLVLFLGACGRSCTSPTTTAPVTAATPAVMFDMTQSYEAGAAATPAISHFEIPVQQGDSLTISLTSAAFDPVLEATPPGAETPLRNDDYLGNRQQSSLTVVVSTSGSLKLGVTTAQRGGRGLFRLLVQRTSAATTTTPTLTAGATHAGELAAGDPAMPDGRFYEQALVIVAPSAPVTVRVDATGPVAPSTVVVDAQGNFVTPQQGAFVLALPGAYRVQVMSPAAGQGAGYRIAVTSGAGGAVAAATTRAHHAIPPPGRETPATQGDIVKGALEEGDARLPTAEPYDGFSVTIAPGGPELSIELTAATFDPYLFVVSDAGQVIENDGAGSLASVSLPPGASGTYRVLVTSFDATGRGAYTLKLAPGARTVESVGAAGAVAAAGPQILRGALAAGDQTLSSGEWADAHELAFTQGQPVHIEARSTAFDTYLIVRPPTGAQQDNDDGPGGGTNAVVDFTAAEAGTHRVLVTSYKPGEGGEYELVVGGGAGGGTTPPPTVANATAVTADETHGALAASDRTLQSGEFADYLTMTFTAGESVDLHLASTAFDPYLIVNTPSGRQLDNDDVNASTRDSGLQIPVAEAGQYTIIVTSYRAGETGPYTLSRAHGQTVPRPGGQGGRVVGLFVGITDYPEGTNDLPECANDAIKLAEELREHGLLAEDRQIVLTDAQATPDAVRGAMQRMAQTLGPDDVFVFFYSGHGGQTTSSTDQGEIDGSDEYIALYGGQIVDDEMGRLFNGIHARLAILALDSCHAGGFAKDVITAPHRIGLFSSEEDVLSAVAGQFQAGGYLSYFLRDGVTGAADANPADGVLTVGELTHYVYAQFAAHAADVQLASAYQHLVVDRGAVRVDTVLWSYR